MTVEVIERPVVKEIAEYCQKRASNVEFVIGGQQSLLNERMWLFLIVTDLALNCAEAGAKTVKVEIDKGKLTVEDDLLHENSKATLAKLNLLSPESTKDRAGSGEGIWNIRQTLGRHNGELKYQAKNGRIIAVATWKE